MCYVSYSMNSLSTFFYMLITRARAGVKKCNFFRGLINLYLAFSITFVSVHVSRWPRGLALIRWSVSSGWASCPETPWNCCGETPWLLNTSTYRWVLPVTTFDPRTVLRFFSFDKLNLLHFTSVKSQLMRKASSSNCKQCVESNSWKADCLSEAAKPWQSQWVCLLY